MVGAICLCGRSTNYRRGPGNAVPAVALAVHAQLPINMSFEEEADTLDHGLSLSSDVAESHLAAVKAF